MLFQVVANMEEDDIGQDLLDAVENYKDKMRHDFRDAVVAKLLESPKLTTSDIDAALAEEMDVLLAIDVDEFVYNEEKNVLTMLLEDPRLSNEAINHAFLEACKMVGLEPVKMPILTQLLADKRVLPGTENNEALIHAATHGHVHIVEVLLTRINKVVQDDQNNPKYVWLAARNNEALVAASRNGWKEVVELLLTKKRVDVSIPNFMALREAIRENHWEIALLLYSRVPEEAKKWAEMNFGAVLEKHMKKPPPSKRQKECANCGIPENLSMCARCNTEVYCSKACQVQHWHSTHKSKCI